MIAPAPAAAPPAALNHDTDVAVVGAGIVGLALAVALARAGFSVASVGPAAPPQAGRTIALLEGSVRFMQAIGAWHRIAGESAPLRTMRLVDDTPSLFRGPPVSFHASDIGLDAFGFNVENDRLAAALAVLAADTPGLRRIEAWGEGFDAAGGRIRLGLRQGSAIEARLLVAADGARSPLRSAAGIAVRESRYPQVALTAVLRHTTPHGDVSTEFHTREGPFTLVPLPCDQAGRCRSSLVWVMRPEEADRRATLDLPVFARAIEAQSRRLLGHVTIEGPVGRFPIRRVLADRLIGPRLALVGEAAHALPPIGAQGLNLSLRDAATLVDVLSASRASGRDIGAAATLADYEAARRGDIALRGGGVHALNMALLTPALPVDAIRGLGLRALGRIAPLRDAVMRQGLHPQGYGEPSLMRSPATARLDAAPRRPGQASVSGRR